MIQKLISLVVLILLYPQRGYPQNPCSICQELKNNVVKIRSIFDDGSNENGFGFVIAEQNNRLYIVTARHVVHQLDDDGLEKKKGPISITFYSELGKEYQGILLGVPNTSLDVALLEVEKPTYYSWKKDFYATDLPIGTEVWFIGRGGDWYIPTGSLVGSVNDISADDEILIDITSIEPGTSGAPLLSQNGIVGLIFEDASVGAKAYPIERVRRLVTKTWNYPWHMNLQTNKMPDVQTDEDQAWVEITSENSDGEKISLLETYVSKGQGVHTGEARKMFEDLLWANINHSQNMEKYVQHFPDGQYIDQVEDKVFKSSTVNPEFYVKLFPNGRYIEEVNKQIERDKKEEADRRAAEQMKEEENRLFTIIKGDLEKDPPAYLNISGYLEKYSQGSFVDQVEELVWQTALRIEAQTPKLDATGKYVWEPATPSTKGHWRRKRANEGKEGFKKYLEYFPNGKYRAAAYKKGGMRVLVKEIIKL